MEPIILTEFEPKTVELTREEYLILIKRFKDKIGVIPCIEEGKYELLPQQFVGTIALPVHSIIIQPKIPMLSFFYMLVYSYEIPEFGKSLYFFEQEQGIYEIIVAKFVQEIEKLVKMGVYKSYWTSEENLPVVKGRILIDSNERINMIQRQRAFCRFSDFTSDIIENRVLKYTLYRLSFLRFRDPFLKAKINMLLHYFDPVSFEVIRDAHFDLVNGSYTRLNEHYRPLIRISRILIENISLSLQKQGKVSFWSFLVDMNKLFQRFVTVCLLNLREWDVRSETVYHWDVKGYTKIRPDMVIRKDKEVKLVLDAKYKHIDLEQLELHGDDIRQIGDYCATLGLKKGVLVYPKSFQQQKIHDFTIEKKDPITNRVYHVLLRTIDLTSTDMKTFTAVCNQFLTQIEEILCSLTNDSPNLFQNGGD